MKKGQFGAALFIVFGLIGVYMAWSVYNTAACFTNASGGQGRCAGCGWAENASCSNFSGITSMVMGFVIPVAMIGLLGGVAVAYGLMNQ